MKKLMTIFGAILFATTILTSCGGGSVESDAKKVADLTCKSKELAQKASSGDMSAVNESGKLALELATLTKEIKAKYTSDSDKQKFDEAFIKEMGNCN